MKKPPKHDMTEADVRNELEAFGFKGDDIHLVSNLTLDGRQYMVEANKGENAYMGVGGFGKDWRQAFNQWKRFYSTDIATMRRLVAKWDTAKGAGE